MKVKNTFACVATILIGTSLLAFGKEEKEETVDWADVPAVVRQAAKELVPRKSIQKIEKDTEDGKVSYEFQIVEVGRKAELTLGVDGTLISTEDVVALTDTPAVVRQTLETQAAGGKMGTVEKVTEDGKTTFETKVEKDGKKTEITVTPDGKVAATEDVTHEKD